MKTLGNVALEDLEDSLRNMSQAIDLGHLEAVRKTIHEMKWMVKELKDETY